jgi:hypothetical protein
MSDLTMTTAQLVDLANALVGIDTMTPPPKPKARYVFGKAVVACESAIKPFTKARQEHMDLYATKGEDGKPIYTPNPDQPGMVHFNIVDGKVEEYKAGLDAMLAEPVTLNGVRQITRAELSDLPITVQQERTFIAAGLLADEEPA